MLVKVFDESHEKDLEQAVNAFLMTNIELIDIKYKNRNIIFIKILFKI